jgi:hypothetical protein
MKKLKVLKLSKRLWLRGDPTNSTLRARDTGKMCCLGFLGRACGVPARALTERGFPSDVDQKYSGKFPPGLERTIEGAFGKSRHASYLADEIAGANDNPDIDDAERARLLAPKFRKLGYRIMVTP